MAGSDRRGVELQGPYALSWSGGKDATHALHRVRESGLEVTHLFNIFEGSSGRVRFHGVRRELIAAQADVLGLELVQASTGPEDFEGAFLRVLEGLAEAGIVGVVFGNIHLEEIRDWYESRTTALGFEHVEPLWGRPPPRLARQVSELGYRALVVSVDLERGDPGWLGRELEADLLEEITARPGVDACGERGEYHTFVWDGPLFRRPVAFRKGEEVEMEGHRFLDLLPGEEQPGGLPADE